MRVIDKPVTANAPVRRERLVLPCRLAFLPLLCVVQLCALDSWQRTKRLTKQPARTLDPEPNQGTYAGLIFSLPVFFYYPGNDEELSLPAPLMERLADPGRWFHCSRYVVLLALRREEKN